MNNKTWQINWPINRYHVCQNCAPWPLIWVRKWGVPVRFFLWKGKTTLYWPSTFKDNGQCVYFFSLRWARFFYFFFTRTGNVLIFYVSFSHSDGQCFFMFFTAMFFIFFMFFSHSDGNVFFSSLRRAMCPLATFPLRSCQDLPLLSLVTIIMIIRNPNQSVSTTITITVTFSDPCNKFIIIWDINNLNQNNKQLKILKCCNMLLYSVTLGRGGLQQVHHNMRFKQSQSE